MTQDGVAQSRVKAGFPKYVVFFRCGDHDLANRSLTFAGRAKVIEAAKDLEGKLNKLGISSIGVLSSTDVWAVESAEIIQGVLGLSDLGMKDCLREGTDAPCDPEKVVNMIRSRESEVDALVLVANQKCCDEVPFTLLQYVHGSTSSECYCAVLNGRYRLVDVIGNHVSTVNNLRT